MASRIADLEEALRQHVQWVEQLFADSVMLDDPHHVAAKEALAAKDSSKEAAS